MTANDNHGSSSRRRFLAGVAATGTTVAAGCSGSTNSPSGSNDSTAGSGTSSGSNSGSDSGNTSTGTTSESKPTLDIWLGVYTESAEKKKYLDGLVQRFEDETGITVNIHGAPYSDITTKLQAAAAGGSLPHMAEISANTGSLRFAQQINDLFKDSRTYEKAPDSLLEVHKTWGSQITGETDTLLTWPLGLRPHVPTWRTDWLESAGIDPSEVEPGAGSLHWYDDLKPMYDRMKQSSTGQKENHYPSHTSMKQSDEEFFVIYLAQFGAGLGGVVNETATASVLDTKEAYEAIRHQVRFIEDGYFHPNSVNWGDEESTTAQWSGDVGEIHNQDTADLWSGYLAEKPKMMKNGGFTWGLPFEQKHTATLVKTPSVALMDGAFDSQAERDAAIQFLDFWAANKQNALKNANNLGFAPASPDIIRNTEFFGKTEMHTKFWRDAVAGALEESKYANISAVPSSAINYEIPRKMHQRILSNDWEVERAADKAAEEINSLLKKHGNR